MKVALVQDYLIQYGGAERVLEEFCNIFPSAPIFTLVYDKQATGYAFEGRDINTSFLQRFPKPRTSYKLFPLFMPMAIENFDFSQYDLVLSSSYAYANGIITRGSAVHVSYCHSPMRYARLDYKEVTGDSMYPKFIKKIIPFFMPYIRLWDMQSSQRPDYYVCNSKFVESKIKKYYKQNAEVIHPPLNFNKFYITKPKDYFLLTGRMVPYKRFDIAVNAFNDLGLPLKIIGTGPEMKKLQKIAKNNIEFVGLVSEQDLPKYYANAQAFIFPQEEDFGITALESMASGRPVIAYKKGGALESIKENDSGVFFDKQTPEALVEAVKKFQTMEFDSEKIRMSVAKFDKLEFRKKIVDFLNKILEEENKIILA
ncbi:MAG: hypothetical protein A3H51_01500 [Candidatus Spechtbacteria bacterium RIFCSPLOWO2_02_FULL_38_8]|uniref:Glycosyl transferase family 1 domain-containing protein n=1 Tax=Candidatus Spechtbacteria bacterium RIFCSPLOWO2_02_FULL_38_8 TaxID=1802164 RepID=A0A1G2HHY6_9BACT|nr:MAG: hypothetical protein A3H51_01500 [Candidatus Spechtbacteria bacterium RIFCSPLOWO2_02_FULL_38_8]